MHYISNIKSGPFYYPVLVFLMKLNEITAPAPYTDYHILIFFGLQLRVYKTLPVYNIKLNLMSAKFYISFYKTGYLFYALFSPDRSIIKLQRKRSAVYGLFKVRRCKAFYNRKGPFQFYAEGGRIIRTC